MITRERDAHDDLFRFQNGHAQKEELEDQFTQNIIVS